MKNVSKDPRVYIWGGSESCPQAPVFSHFHLMTYMYLSDNPSQMFLYVGLV